MNEEPHPIHKELTVLRFADAPAFGQWLEEHHTQKEAVWLQFAIEGSPEPGLTYTDARDTALCFGWIDSELSKWDATSYLVQFARRTPGAPWTPAHRQLVLRLAAEGAMHPAGLKEVAAAKADGRWERAALAQSKSDLPQDFQEALNTSPQAALVFEKLDRSERYTILARINEARKPESRVKRIKDAVSFLARAGVAGR